MTINKPIVTTLIIIIISLLAYFLVIPKYNEFKTLRGDLAYKVAEFNAKQEYYADITKFYYVLQSRKDDIAKIDDALPSGSNFGQLIYFFQKKALENGLAMEDMFLSQSSLAKTKNTAGDVVFSLSLSGFYSSLESFLNNIESSSRLFEVTSISFGEAKEEATEGEETPTESQFEQSGVHTFSLEIKTHSY